MTKPNGKTILLVEDDEQIVNITADSLENQGFEVIKAKNGEEGLEKAIKFKPDLILLDIVMPVMDGMTMLGKLRADAWGKTAKVIILSNLSGTEDVHIALENEVFDYLTKVNWSLEDLVKMVKEKLGIE